MCDGNSTADTSDAGSPWLDITWRDRFQQMLRRAEARLHPNEFGPIESLVTEEQLLEDPEAAIAALLERYPDAETLQLHPADVPFFVQLCKMLGKPVNFVPVIDKDVRRWWRSDSLWQAHDARYDADQVCIIPGTAAVAGITRVDEPVGALLDRFEQAAVDQVMATNGQPEPRAARRQGRSDVTGSLAVLLDAPDVLWAGRIATNPVHRIAAPTDWQVHENPTGERLIATHASTGARLEAVDDAHVALSVPLSGTWIDIRFTLTEVARDGGTPLVSVEDAASAMRAVLAIAADVDGPDALPPVHGNAATATVQWDPEQVADHTGVTATFGAPLAPTLSVVPDALVGRCWPAVDGEREPIPLGVDLTAYRVTQEALTNTLKHAGPSTAYVHISYQPAQLRVTVADDGHGIASVLDGRRQGHGLLGMRERVALYGGSLAVGPRPGGGFEVRVRIPYDNSAV